MAAELLRSKSKSTLRGRFGRMLFIFALILTAGFPTAQPSTVKAVTAKRRIVPSKARVSWYGPRFHGRLTANGERFDQMAMTCAHKKLPLGSLVLVKNPENGKQVVLRVTDRGPYVKGRDFDLSMGAAEMLGFLDRGVAHMEVTRLKKGTGGLLEPMES